MAKKQIMEKRELLMNDTVDKFSSVVESLNLYFNCCLCGKLMKDPVTVTLCGHSYCSKCTRGYEDYCEECNTGLPVEKVFANKHLANGLTKFQFLLLLFVEVQKVFARPAKPT
jgi:hypothetical protein